MHKNTILHSKVAEQDNEDRGASKQKEKADTNEVGVVTHGEKTIQDDAGEEADKKQADEEDNLKKEAEERALKEADERAKKALAMLDAASARAATMTNFDSPQGSQSSGGDIQVVDETPGTSVVRKLSLDYEDIDTVWCKIRWKYGSTVIRVEVGRSEQLAVLFQKFSEKVDVDKGNLAFKLNGKVLKATDTCMSAGITITSFIDAFERVDDEEKDVTEDAKAGFIF